MYDTVCDVFNGVLLTRGAEVAILVEITLNDTIKCSNQGKAPNVEFSTMYQKRSLYVLLHYMSSSSVIFRYYIHYLSQRAAYNNITSSISILTWFYNPNIVT